MAPLSLFQEKTMKIRREVLEARRQAAAEAGTAGRLGEFRVAETLALFVYPP